VHHSKIRCRLAAMGHFRRISRDSPSVHVGFAPKAIEVLRCRRLTRCAKERHHLRLADHGHGIETKGSKVLPAGNRALAR
jgi:hypothetical protein